MGKLIDLTGQHFGRWTVIEKAPSKKKETMWLCECSCEKHTRRVVSGRNLRNGKTTSCGCWKDEKTSQRCTEDLTGQIFGKLKVIKRASSQCSHATWYCKCNCGNPDLIEVAANHLKSGAIKSCGCISSSYGEDKIQELLNQNNIPYVKEKVFENCIISQAKTAKPCRFDFYVNNQYVIEFDGLQHFEPVEYFGGEEEYKKRKISDVFKNEYCKQNNIPIIRIPYWHSNQLCLEDLLLETSQFLLA